MIDIDKEIKRLIGGDKKVKSLIIEQHRIGALDMNDKGIYDPQKLKMLEAQRISIKDRVKLLVKLRKV